MFMKFVNEANVIVVDWLNTSLP